MAGKEIRPGDQGVASDAPPKARCVPSQMFRRNRRLIQILLAAGLDLVLGDPRNWPHISRLTGWLAKRYETGLTGNAPRTVGVGIVFWFCVVGTLLLLYGVALRCCVLIGPGAVFLLDTAIIYQCIAAKDLQEHAEAVLKPLERLDLDGARLKLSWMVGRDTYLLDEAGIARGVIESVAESLTDGIIAPLFWALIGGAPGALVYRATNTLDSIVGHRTEPYERFGKASARLDDLLNWVPARFCALLFCICKQRFLLGTIAAEASGHASPNAGWSESAMAHVLGVRLGGENFYEGKLVRGPVFNPGGRQPWIADIKESLKWMWIITGSGLILFLAAASFCLNAMRSK